MAEIIIGRNPGQESLEKFLRLLAGGGTNQQGLAAQGAAAVGYLNQAESLSQDIQGVVDDTSSAILRMMTDGDPQARQAGMELYWSHYVGRRAARQARELDLDVLFE